MILIKKKQNGQSHLELDVYKENLYPRGQVTSTHSTYQENKLTSTLINPAFILGQDFQNQQ